MGSDLSCKYPDVSRRISYEVQMLSTRVTSLEEISAANTQRFDALFESLGELSGTCSSIQKTYESTRESNERLSAMRFDKEIFYREIRTLSYRSDTLFSRTSQLDSLAKDMTDDLDDFLGRSRFLEIIEVTNSMISEARSVNSRLKVQESSFGKTNFQKLHFDMLRLISSIQSTRSRVEELNGRFMQSQKELSSVSRRFVMLVQKKNFFEQNSSLISRYLAISGKMDALYRKLQKTTIDSPNFLFIGQSLHNYVSGMVEKGFRTDYIEEYLAKRGVDRSLAKMVIDNVNSSAGEVCDLHSGASKNSKLFKS